MFGTAKHFYKRNYSILQWIVVDLFVIRWTTKTWKYIVRNLPRERLLYLKNQNVEWVASEKFRWFARKNTVVEDY